MEKQQIKNLGLIRPGTEPVIYRTRGKHINHYLVVKLKLSLRKLYTVTSITWLTVGKYLCHKWPRILSVCHNHNPVLSSFITYHRVRNKSNTTGPTCGAGTTYPSSVDGFLLPLWYLQTFLHTTDAVQLIQHVYVLRLSTTIVYVKYKIFINILYYNYYFNGKNICLYTVDNQDMNLTKEFTGKKLDLKKNK